MNDRGIGRFIIHRCRLVHQHWPSLPSLQPRYSDSGIVSYNRHYTDCWLPCLRQSLLPTDLALGDERFLRQRRGWYWCHWKRCAKTSRKRFNAFQRSLADIEVWKLFTKSVSNIRWIFWVILWFVVIFKFMLEKNI